jgi:hypothetical protein
MLSIGILIAANIALTAALGLILWLGFRSYGRRLEDLQRDLAVVASIVEQYDNRRRTKPHVRIQPEAVVPAKVCPAIAWII